MKTSLQRIVVVLVAGSAAIACATAATVGEPVGSSESGLRELSASEILGEISWGETKDVDLTPSPKYRAFWFMGERGDQIQAQVVSRDATDPVLWLTDESFNTITWSNDARTTDSNPLISGRYLTKTGKYFLVFREMNSAPRATFSVSLRKLGVLPLECDPDGEGIINPDCTDPHEFDPFDPNVCSGEPITATEAKDKFAGPTTLRLDGAKVFYRTRQCRSNDAAAAPDCSEWQRAFAMDIKLLSIGLPATAAVDGGTPASAPADSYVFNGDGRAKVKIDFGVAPVALKSFCVDGPFTNLRGTDWGGLADGTPGVCGAAVDSFVMTSSCARLEAKPIQLASGDPSYWTEMSPILFARF